MSSPRILRPGLALCPTGMVAARPWVLVAHGRIDRLGEGPLPPVPAETEVVDEPELVLLPGFVNAHTHLVLTSLAGRLEPTSDFWGWILALVVLVRTRHEQEILQSFVDGLALSLSSGTTTLLDFARPETPPASSGTPLRALRAEEIITFRPDGDQRRLEALLKTIPALAAPHAVYTTAPEALRSLADHVRRSGGLLTIHVSETEDENRLWLLGEAEGPARYFEHFKIDRSNWECPRCTPTRHLADHGALGPRSLLVHCNYLSDEDVALIAASGATVCLCPATHRFFGHSPHPLPRLLRAGVPVCLGTDSLASSPSLSMWDQVRIVAESHPALGWPELLAMITTRGARALGLGEEHGTLRPGAPADLVLAWPRVALDEIIGSPRRLFEDDVAVQEVLVGGQSVLAQAG